MALWRKIRKIWAITGSVVFVVFTLWALIAYQAWGVDGAMASDDRVEVIDAAEAIHFRPRDVHSSSGLLFFPAPWSIRAPTPRSPGPWPNPAPRWSS